MREYEQIYLLAKQRQQGCDEIGEVAILKELNKIYQNQKGLIRYNIKLK